ncbi:MAG: protein TolQ [Thiobacillaceae bacterium]|nr:protein TolQ [Thiobacillaceae bacterium]MCX7672890.1 protein TolQ [Thiobacillaceae bacterium]MDW8324280.1 protein TolQ [Burkholderiales bacterium]
MNLTVEHDLSLLNLVLSASWVVQAVMLLLVVASVASWWVIFVKYQTLRRELGLTRVFEQRFFDAIGSKTINELYAAVDEAGDQACIESLFRQGHRVFMNLTAPQMAEASQDSKPQPVMDGVQVMETTRRALQAAYQREMDQLEESLPFLATVGSVSPYVGLFGTVWGIMNAFRGLADVSQATLAQVAPGIAEALIATAIGLFAAIPAVVAYNRFSHDVDRLSNRLQVFIEEYLVLIQRGVLHAYPGHETRTQVDQPD